MSAVSPGVEPMEDPLTHEAAAGEIETMPGCSPRFLLFWNPGCAEEVSGGLAGAAKSGRKRKMSSPGMYSLMSVTSVDERRGMRPGG